MQYINHISNKYIVIINNIECLTDKRHSMLVLFVHEEEFKWKMLGQQT